MAQNMGQKGIGKMDTFPYLTKDAVIFVMSKGINYINSFHLKRKKG